MVRGGAPHENGGFLFILLMGTLGMSKIGTAPKVGGFPLPSKREREREREGEREGERERETNVETRAAQIKPPVPHTKGFSK